MLISTLDIIFIVVITLFMIRGYLRGFVTEVTVVAAIVFGVLASVFFFKNGGDFVRAQFMPEVKIIPEIIAFLGLFLIVFLVIRLLGLMIKGIVEKVELGKVDRVLGILFGLAFGIAIVSFALFILKIQPLFDSTALLSESFFARFLLPFITGQENLTGV